LPCRCQPHFSTQLSELAVKAHLSVGGLDISRADMRLDADGQPCLIEINTLPGLTPDFSDLCVIAKAQGISYQDLILEILYLGASRYGLMSLLSDLQGDRWPILRPMTSRVQMPLLLR